MRKNFFLFTHIEQQSILNSKDYMPFKESIYPAEKHSQKELA